MIKTKTKFKQTEIGMIPEEWSVDYLKNNVEKIFVGRDPEGGKQSHSNDITKYRIIQSAPVFDGYIDNKKVGYISEESYLNLASALVQEDDVLLNQLGDGITFARSCIVPKDILPAIITRSVGCIRCNKNKLDPWFLNAYLVMPKTKKYIESFNSGSSRRAIDGGKMRSFIVPLPDIKEQKKIGYFYKIIRDKIELNKQMNNTIEEISKTIFKHWFINFEFPNEEGKPYKSSGGKMIYNEELEKDIPKGWYVEHIQELCTSITNGSTPRRMQNQFWNGNIAWFKTGELNDNSLIESEELITEEGLKNSACKICDINTILIALYASPTVGRLGLLKIKGTFNQACSGLLAKKEIGYPFLFYTLFFKRNELNNIAVGAAQQNINQEILKRTRTIVPTETILVKFNKIVEILFDKKTMILIQNKTFSTIRDSLLPKLMSGRIRVSIEVN